MHSDRADVVDDGGDERDVVGQLRMGHGVPVRQLAGALRRGHHEPLGLGRGAEVAHGRLAGRAAQVAVEVDHERHRRAVVRGGDESGVPAVGAVGGEVHALVGGTGADGRRVGVAARAALERGDGRRGNVRRGAARHGVAGSGSGPGRRCRGHRRSSPPAARRRGAGRERGPRDPALGTSRRRRAPDGGVTLTTRRRTSWRGTRTARGGGGARWRPARRPRRARRARPGRWCRAGRRR